MHVRFVNCFLSFLVQNLVNKQILLCVTGDILEFYKTPVDDLTPIQHLNTKDLPPNLHIQLEPKRFNPGLFFVFNIYYT